MMKPTIRVSMTPEDQAKHEREVDAATPEIYTLGFILQEAAGVNPPVGYLAPLYLGQATAFAKDRKLRAAVANALLEV